MSIANKALAFREHQKQLLHSNKPDAVAVTNNTDTRYLHENCSHSVAAKRLKSSSLTDVSSGTQNRKIGLGDVTSLNLTALHAGLYYCIIIILYYALTRLFVYYYY